MVQAKYKGDSRRTYLIGESLGAEGALYLLSGGRAARRFAAAASIAGSVEPYDWENWKWTEDWGEATEDDWGNKTWTPVDRYAQVAKGIPVSLPMAVVHGKDDPYVPVEMAQNIKKALEEKRRAPGNLIMTLLGLHRAGALHYMELDAGHEVWTEAYRDGLIDWLL